MGLLYPKVFGGGVDAVEDKVLQAQLATLSFVNAEHVGLADSCVEGEHWEGALRALLRMGGFRVPADKIDCVVDAVEHLGCLVDKCDGKFVRLVALAVLKAQPPHIHSQLEFVARFVHPNQLWAPRSGGAFTLLRAALQYVAPLDPIGLSQWSREREP